ncbi:hypothetical protein CEXT_770841 [Caerostris extrusa]|uniref:Uncharacterized protein n=1 Tax=Caerostris extrusa TaxID=172846 RepID=A0AAV4QJ57_CAEEX|nr:hypothetical protein CEXT_770841 [Caerostris extrusa]
MRQLVIVRDNTHNYSSLEMIDNQTNQIVQMIDNQLFDNGIVRHRVLSRPISLYLCWKMIQQTVFSRVQTVRLFVDQKCSKHTKRKLFRFSITLRYLSAFEYIMGLRGAEVNFDGEDSPSFSKSAEFQSRLALTNDGKEED